MPELPTHIDKVIFAETNFRGERKRFGIKLNDRRRHVYIIGKTGMGKSTLLENMTIQDIRAGRGLAVIDPHGEYAEKMLDFIPRPRVNDVIYFNPADTGYPVAFNIMEKVEPDQRHLVASGLLGVFKKIWPDVWSPRMEYLLANAILALLEIPGATLLGINRMFGEKEFRKRIVSQLADPIIRGFWENEFAKYPEQFMREAVAAIQNKVGQFSSNPLIRNIIGQTDSAVDMREMMDNQKIFVVNLSKGKVGEENARLLGAMIVTKLYLTAMTRVDLPEEQRRDFYLYVDEFQNFATESFANILSEARKYRLDLTIAHQYMAQMDETVQDAVLGNVGSMILFRIGAADAEILEKEFMPEFVTQDLVNLGFAQIYLKLMIDGIASRPFSAQTLPPFPRPAESLRETIVRVSRERYSTPRDVVEEKIRRFAQGVTEESPRAAEISGTKEGPPAGGVAAAPSAKPEREMYEAHCAVDGKVVMVPFKPDGKRPIYCEEHMHMIKFRQKAHETPLKDESVRQSTGARPVSLRELKKENTGAVRQAPGSRSAKSSNLTELREALAKALSPKGPAGPQPLPAPRLPGGAAANQAGVIRPGETVRLE